MPRHPTEHFIYLPYHHHARKFEDPRQYARSRVECAIKALQRNRVSSIRKAASIYRVNYKTLRRRLQGHLARAETVTNSRSLDDDEEQTLNEWILDVAARGYPPRKCIVEDTANLLRRLRGNPPVGVNWVNNYARRTPKFQIA